MSEYVVEEPSCDGSASWRVRESIVRCRDCKHASYYKDVLWCSELGGDDSMPVEPNYFCAWGSRK